MFMGFDLPTVAIMLLLAGGGSDALDFIPTDAYWRQHQVTVSVETMLDELHEPETAGADVSALITQLGSTDFEQREVASRKLAALGSEILPQLEDAAESDDLEIASRAEQLIAQLDQPKSIRDVRRLMAIRTLGELKDAKSAPVLRPLTDSDAPFVGEYAQRAIASIEDKPFEPKRPTDEELMSDLWLLPANCAIVGQHKIRGGNAVTLEQLVRQGVGPFAQPAPNPQMQAMQQQQLEHLVQRGSRMVDLLNNGRLDAITFGISDNADEQRGFAVFIFRGAYDRDAVIHQVQRRGEYEIAEVDGVWTIKVPFFATAWLVSADRCVLVMAPEAEQAPASVVLDAIHAAKQPLTENADLAALVESTDTKSMTWAAMRVSETYRRQMTQLQSFETIRATADREGDSLAWKVVAEGDDAEKAKVVAAEINQQVRNILAEIRQAPVFAGPFVQPMLSILQSVRTETDEGNLTVHGTAPQDLFQMAAAMNLSVMAMMPAQFDMDFVPPDVEMMEAQDAEVMELEDTEPAIEPQEEEVEVAPQP